MGLISRVSSRTYRRFKMSRRNPWLDDEQNTSSSNNGNSFDPNRDYLQEHVQKQQDTLASQQRALRVLTETEQIGADTAVELSRQGEVLTRAEQKVDNINENLNTAEHHIKTIKSRWGGFTNKFKKQPQQVQKSGPTEEVVENTSESAHKAVVNQMNNQQQNPTTSSSSSSQPKPASGQMHQYDLYENQIDTNLDQMSAGLGRLKNMGL